MWFWHALHLQKVRDLSGESRPRSQSFRNKRMEGAGIRHKHLGLQLAANKRNSGAGIRQNLGLQLGTDPAIAPARDPKSAHRSCQETLSTILQRSVHKEPLSKAFCFKSMRETFYPRDPSKTLQALSFRAVDKASRHATLASPAQNRTALEICGGSLQDLCVRSLGRISTRVRPLQVGSILCRISRAPRRLHGGHPLQDQTSFVGRIFRSTSPRCVWILQHLRLRSPPGSLGKICVRDVWTRSLGKIRAENP